MTLIYSTPNIFHEFIRSKLVWRGLKLFFGNNSFLNELKKEAILSEAKKIRSDHFQKLTVKNGPFKGMVYPEWNSRGSMLLPKLFGTYENELWDVIEKIKSNKYAEIIDIGCAEGYYAIGFARIFPSSKIVACDIDKKSRELCKRMAKANQVEDRVLVSGKFSLNDLKLIDHYSRNLIISDCEGFENELFTEEALDHLINSDLIIETHDFIIPGTLEKLSQLFSQIHHLEIISTLNEEEKLTKVPLPELKSYLPYIRRRLISEQRPGTMYWLALFSKNNY
jgi:predicted O-methyltransferase YrrM